MASGKKSKKTKGKTLALTDFLQETTGSIPTQPIRKSTTTWAEEVDDYDAIVTKAINVVLPTAPKASRDYEDIADKVPMEPPFIAYLSNLPYDVEEDEIADFFRNLRISTMRIPKDERPGEPAKLKGYGYVEFEDRESLMGALIIPDTNLKNRRIRIEVAANSENDRRRGGRMGDRMGSGADTGGDWRSSNRPEPMEERRGGFNRDREGGFNRDREGGFNRDREGGGGAFTREGMREPGARDREYGGFNRDREGGGGFNRDREGGGFNRDREGGGFNRDFNRDRDGGGFNRNRDQDDRPGAWRDGDRPTSFNDRDKGFSRGNYRDSDRNNRYEDREDRRGGGGGGFRRYEDSERNGSSARTGDRDDKEPAAPSSGSETRQRPKLNLAPRTKPIEQTDAKAEPAAPAASIFGNAKPVDTTERERQVEEKLLKEQEERLAGSRDKDTKDEDNSRRNIERGRPPVRREDKDSEDKDQEPDNRDRGPSSRERRNASGDDNRRSSRIDNQSPDNKKKPEKVDKPKREEKHDRSEKELPKFQEAEPPNFQGSNKFALLDDASD
ncbi:unnamed protein product [Ceutorhynchus assimilis]|uniref:RRM domain-containing protein n=1 Tax=Ceutorhynchus assimilis TaxID=467358 RepID=A0A9N9QH08_9CUCU|nr:unnamed protein product [Ceutorhynchus assimilis]